MTLTYKKDHWIAHIEDRQLPISGTEELGFRPSQLFTSAIAGCFGEMLIHVCRKKRISYEGLTITPETTRAGAVNKISCIHLHILFEAINTSDEQIDKVITLALKHCSMVQSVKGSIDITFSHARI
ncbi:osmotically inducible protein C [Bacillus safensis]|uniref:OsmC family protein n=1 Tax=Bacillus TaxID=1386 RepID=UPI0018CE3091|nr:MULTISPECIES: OsmC family protein [Bacillus]MBG9821412.1 osmotically inducible protein C [Bacillus safensis]MBG9822937.1 osmotically inducible protein C [Bacillus safensis]MBG9832573.1 osmotically inducible protein C [Bacillus safensis]MBG9859669.1 osmotically inducible protein C [Bacillus safensis]MBG9897974.1 osmotically inducible protein C [Bacillus safensis]